ncbi:MULTISPECIES: reverse transcriptase/maturase family protein [Bacteroidales]|jgi:group II intron reverse transcriptase/maturase|uniref:Group II intron reverse transcriptase/maturase n=1 Tax=Lepagella muris TaxID=3032870 RepID=A0AC61RN81_9BACT|nr:MULTISPECIES: reverse transcriptase/maturase family protein [Bacteroidales]RXE61538.1 group II intron reverse transcriptase/maturase [Muribaculaceae bacterium Isolate-004 (NCI)]TGY81064.1 group II intron reverse transcriptase/maturase [Lepagella muris]THG54142.1 group II intron reverse transcriptase/maturase [Bacteroidales bacterium]TKC59644.1 group II intron reverse transcriptase/maturase [Bacteroidales bacterium]
MRSPETVLNNLSKHSSDLGYKYERLYRLLFNEEMFFLAYQRIYAKQGNMTPGTDGRTVDQMSIQRIERLIDALRTEEYQPHPAKRVYIPKKNGKKRPLGIPSFDDKLVQEVTRMILEAIYEGHFEYTSHGFRPHRSCHTALTHIQDKFTGAKWFIEGDIKGFFDNIKHEILVNILKERIADERFIRLIRKFLKAGYAEQWKFHNTYSGTPQGGIVSPILANIYLDKFDKYMKMYADKFNKGERRKVSSEYRRLNNKKTRLAKKLKSVTDESVRAGMITEIKETLAQTYVTPCHEPMDANYRRIQYVRYADDFLIGVIGSKSECQAIKADIKEFMTEQLGLELSDEKTLITNAKDKAKFLGYEIFVRSKAFMHKDSRGVMKRFGNGSVLLHVSMDTAKAKLLEYGALRIAKEGNQDIWKPKPRGFMIGNKVEDIVAQYNTEIRGFYNYYAIANNISTIGHSFGYIMEYSMYKTIAQKLNLTMSQAKLKFLKDKKFIVPFTGKNGEVRYRIFYDGGFKRKEPFNGSIVDYIPNTAFVPKLSLMERLKTGTCEICGKKGNLIMHHVRNLNQLKADSPWNAIMIKKRRKTLAICESCNEVIQNHAK